MFQDGGPPHPGPPHLYPKMPMNGPGPVNRPGPSRRDAGSDSGRDRDDRSNGYGRPEPSSSRSYLNPPYPRFPPREGDRGLPDNRAPLRARTPSPPRRAFDRGRELERDRDRDRGLDVRDRLSLDTGRLRPSGQSSERPEALPSRKPPLLNSPPLQDRGPDRDWDRGERRWPERRDDRFRDSRPIPSSGRTSPLKGANRFPTDRWSPPDAPRGPRALAAQTPPSVPPSSRAPSGPRSAANTTPISWAETDPRGCQSGDLGKDLKRLSSRGLPPSQNRRTVSTPLVDPPKAPRSMRGSSSPVELKRITEGFLTNHATAVSLPAQVKKETSVADLEEGEVISPVRQERRTWPNEADRRPRERTFAREPWSPRGSSRGDVAWRRRRIGSFSPGRRRRSPTPPRWINGQADRADMRRRSLSPVTVHRYSAQRPAPSSTRSETVQQLKTPPLGIDTVQHIERPPTPSDPPPTRLTVDTLPLHAISLDFHRPATPAFPPPSPAGTQTSSSLLRATTSMAEVSSVLAIEDDQLSTMNGSLQVSTPPRSPQAQRPSVTLGEHMAAAGAEETAASSGPGVPNGTPTEDVSTTQPEEVISEGRVASGAKSPDVIPDAPGTDVMEDRFLTLPREMQTGLKETDVSASFAVKQASSPPVAAPTSSSESATPALPSTKYHTDLEIVVDDYASGQNALVPKEQLETIDFDEPKDQLDPSGVLEEAGLPLVIDASKRVTIAERRLVVLPVTTGSLSSPLNAKFRQDPVPTAGSVQEGIAEPDLGRKTVEMEDNRSQSSDASQSGFDAVTQEDLRVAIKALQAEPFEVNLDLIAAWNLAAAPTASTRISISNSPTRRETCLRELAWPLNQSQTGVAKRVTAVVTREIQGTERHIKRLQSEYLGLDADWRAHCEYLDDLIQRRGPPPADLYAMPGALPLVTPGPVPITPVFEMDMSGASRLGRRRAGPGGGDAVATEAEFLELLAGFADNAAKDPTFRANKTTAVVPDMLPPKERQSRYHDENDLVTDPWAFYDIAQSAGPIWTDEERILFTRRFLAYPKQFGRIAEGFSEKTASECVVYYYRTKKSIDYKGMLASKRGDKRKKSIQLKKGGKSSALLANLDRAKPTVDKAPAAPSMTATPYRAAREDSAAPIGGGKSGKGPRSEIIPMTPDETGGRKGMFLVDDADSTLLRASSEASVTKLKMRINVKNTKRPRVSSVANPNGLLTTMLPELDENGALIQPEPVVPSQLLPPIKRAGKRRKVTDPVEASSDVALVSDKPSRKAATNSYWSVEEKKRFRDLFAVHGTDFRQIAAELGTAKSERQVANFFDAHKDEMRLEEFMPMEAPNNLSEIPMASFEVDPRVNRIPHDGKAFGPSPPKLGQFGRSIYDVYARPPSGSARPSEMFERRYPSEPRLGMFPPAPHLAPPSLSRFATTSYGTYPSHAESSAQTLSRTGGMRISALLNDESMQEPRSAEMLSRPLPDIDAASDGTVSERDVEAGVTRRSPRPLPPSLGALQERRPSESSDRPNFEKFHAAPAAPRPYEARQPIWREPHQSGYYPARAATAVPGLHPARERWEPPRPSQSAPGPPRLGLFPSQQLSAEPYRSRSDGPRLPQHETYHPRSTPPTGPSYDRQRDTDKSSGYGGQRLGPPTQLPLPASHLSPGPGPPAPLHGAPAILGHRSRDSLSAPATESGAR